MPIIALDPGDVRTCVYLNYMCSGLGWAGWAGRVRKRDVEWTSDIWCCVCVYVRIYMREDADVCGRLKGAWFGSWQLAVGRSYCRGS